MIVQIGERVLHRANEHTVHAALYDALYAHHLGMHVVVVPPSAQTLIAGSGLDPSLSERLTSIGARWLQAQALLRNASRVIELTGDPAEDGASYGRAKLVYTGRYRAVGMHREPSYVVEALAADGAYTKLLMQLIFDLQGEEFSAYWFARPELGGGANSFTYVERYMTDPSPTLIICDRDGPDHQTCGTTARSVVERVVASGIYPDEHSACTHGFSPNHPTFGFRLLSAHELENLITPHIAELLLSEILPRSRSLGRRTALDARWPRFPRLTPGEVQDWLSTDFKHFDSFGKLFSSNILTAIVDYANDSEANFAKLRHALGRDLQDPNICIAVSEITADLWAVGVRFSTPL